MQMPMLDISYKLNQGMWLFMTDFFHLASCFQGSSILEHLSALHSFLWMNNVVLPVHQLLPLCVVLTF